MAALHGQMLGHLVKRGVDMMKSSEPALPAISMAMDRDDLMQSQQEAWNRLFQEIPPWSLLLIGLTVLIFYVFFLSVSAHQADPLGLLVQGIRLTDHINSSPTQSAVS